MDARGAQKKKLFERSAQFPPSIKSRFKAGKLVVLSTSKQFHNPFSHPFGMLGQLGNLLAQLGLYLLSLPACLILKCIRSDYNTWKITANHYLPIFDSLAYYNACWVAAFAKRSVPAYKSFLENRSEKNCLKSLASYPETSKENYAKAYDFPSQCQNGEVKVRGTTVDESSGASGQPFNWMRSAQELRDIHLDIANYIRLEFPSDKLFTLNAFSLGAWTTGVNISRAANKVGIVKTIGPDIDCIIQTLNTFGPGFDYLITGYPPFLKRLCDRLDADNFSWGRYTLYGLVGGEGITEALRDYLERRFRKIRSGYGASDLQISLGAESDFTVRLRKQLIQERALRYRLLGHGEDRIPMIFQYNPFENYIETNKRLEVIITLNNLSVMCPKIRYNIGDEGKVFSYSKVIQALKSVVPGWRGMLHQCRDDHSRLPLLFLFGRKDNVVSYMGANIHPQDIEYGIYADEKYASSIESFFLSLEETDHLLHSPTINIQLQPDVRLSEKELENMTTVLKEGISRHLSRVSRDYAQAVLEDPKDAQVHLQIFHYGEGVFARKKNGIKTEYVIRK